MNAPYDGDRGRGAHDTPAGQGPPTPQGQQPHDPYVHDAYANDPYRSQDPTAQDPVNDVFYDRSAHPPPPPGQAPHPLYQQPPAPQHTPDPQVWAPTPPPEPQGPTRHLPYGDDAATTQFVGVDDLISRAADERREPDAFAHLYRDQQQPYEPQRPMTPQQEPVPQAASVPEQPPTPAPEPAAPAKRSGGRASSLLKSSAVMAAGTLVSRILGFVRNLVIAAAIGVGTLNDSYQVANTLPTMIYILVGGGALNAVFIPQLVRAMKNDEDGGEAYANRLLTLVTVLMAGITTVCVLAAPVFIGMMSPKIASDPEQMDVAVAFARYCLPTMFFMGVHVVLGQILNARGRFGAMMWTPVLNNVIVIATFGAFIWVFGSFSQSGVSAGNVSADAVRLLGIGTLLGLTVQALAMFPYLRDAGFRLRPRFDWRGHGLGKAARLAKWTFFFVLANQLGLVVVTQIATWAGSVAEGQGHSGTGITAYNYALQLWQMPQAIITVSVMTAVLPRISRAAHDGDVTAVRDDISYGLRTSAVAIVPCAFAFLALGVPMATLMFSSAGAGATNIGYVIMAFGLGLIPYSAQYVILRGFYAYEDTRTPFFNTVIVAAVNAAVSGLCFLVLPARWVVVGLAAAYGLAYAVGVGVAWRRLRTRLGGDLDGPHVIRTYARLAGACVPAALVGGAAAYGITLALGSGFTGSLAALVGGGVTLIAVFFLAAKRMRVEEMNAMVGMVRAKLGR
ncbi:MULTISPECIES: murein biosynthesis integral membrane protein MurJ [Streptomyces]|uniref:murein biosynthesis integral membrane protein MurJ n=1 Tax=Streptomyces TaxID=1883 RepID=UPI0004C7DE31|nr:MULTISPECIES: murein biosynthesis integral membrane protein MurJ [Streptomyces]KOT47953.1 membrane protein [Streptomyces rimosus subsp. rimosus]